MHGNYFDYVTTSQNVHIRAGTELDANASHIPLDHQPDVTALTLSADGYRATFLAVKPSRLAGWLAKATAALAPLVAAEEAAAAILAADAADGNAAALAPLVAAEEAVRELVTA